MAINALDVAKYFLAQMDDDSGDTISNLKLQKLLYYAQGFHLAILDKPLFADQIKAWQHGPVVRSVYDNYREYGAGAIPKPTAPFTKFATKTRKVLDDVYRVYGQFSAWKLRNLTHGEPPWKEAPRDSVISRAALKTYFRTQVV